ncbi:hypothetical protein [Deinococcus sonorensis]|uniref:Uncharacterized protein n=1 Tax=Deinococcus sonorensis TaxID=309891 RepID=A0ABV8Y8C9_9DEIO
MTALHVPRGGWPSVDPADWQTLMRLVRARVWSEDDARAAFLDLAQLAQDRVVVMTPSPAGPMVFVGPMGWQMQGRAPHTRMASEPHANLLYLRLACRHFGWPLLKEPAGFDRRFSGTLDRMGHILVDGREARLLARVSGGGYHPKTVRDVFRFVHSTLFADRTPLVVVVPDVTRLRGRVPNHDLLILREYRVTPPVMDSSGPDAAVCATLRPQGEFDV